jgi:hypothetical protein
MKYLKSYKIFESNLLSIKDDINDIMLELADNGFDINWNFTGVCRYTPPTLEEPIKALSFDIERNNPFTWSDIEETIERLEEYCWREGAGYSIDIKYKIVYMHVDRFIEIFGKEELNKLTIVIYSDSDYHDALNGINESKIESNIITKDEFPSEDDIREFFFDLSDNLPYCDINISEIGYVSLSKEFVFDNDLSSRGDDNLKAAITPVEKLNRPSGRLHSHYPIWILLSELGLNQNSKVGSFKDRFYQNIINGNYPSYPFIELKRIYFDYKPENVELLTDCLMRLYHVTGFRPVGNFKLEDFVDEDTGNIVTLYIANIKLFKVTDVEYKNLIKSIVIVDNYRGIENIEMTQKFL